MTVAAERLREELSGLSIEERTDLAHFLIESLDGETEINDPIFEAELERRADEIRNGKEPGIPGDEVFAELHARHS